MGFSRQECWSGLPFPSPGDLPDPGNEPRSPALQADALLSEPPGKPLVPHRVQILPGVNWQFTLCLSARNRVLEIFSQNSCSILSFQLVLYTCAIDKVSLCVLAQDCCSLLPGVRLMVGTDYSSSSFSLRQALYIWTSGVEITPVADNLCFLHSARWI